MNNRKLIPAGRLWRSLQRWKKGKRRRPTWKGRRRKEITKPERCITSSAQSRLVYLSLTAHGSHLGTQTDRDKLAGWMGHDLLKRYHRDTTSSSIPCCCVGARRHPGWSDSSFIEAAGRGWQKGPSQHCDPPRRA